MRDLALVPLSLAAANDFVARHHRHRVPVVGHLWSTGAELDGQLVGVSIIGRPVARGLQDGRTVEVIRLATDGTRDVPSFLLGAAARAAFGRGFLRVVTYTLPSESGSSLRGAGYRVVAEVRGRSWSCRSRPRIDRYDPQDKLRWELAV